MKRWLRNLFKTESSPHQRPFTGTCMVKETTGDGHFVGRCYYPTYGGTCCRHGNVAVYLGDPCEWPYDHQLAKWRVLHG